MWAITLKCVLLNSIFSLFVFSLPAKHSNSNADLIEHHQACWRSPWSPLPVSLWLMHLAERATILSTPLSIIRRARPWPFRNSRQHFDYRLFSMIFTKCITFLIDKKALRWKIFPPLIISLSVCRSLGYAKTEVANILCRVLMISDELYPPFFVLVSPVVASSTCASLSLRSSPLQPSEQLCARLFLPITVVKVTAPALIVSLSCSITVSLKLFMDQ